jgi:hypothetical protein
LVQAILKIARVKRLEQEIPLEQFQALAKRTQDTSSSVRERMIEKLFHGLRHIQFLPLKYLALLGFGGLDSDRENAAKAKKYLGLLIMQRRKWVKDNEDKFVKETVPNAKAKDKEEERNSAKALSTLLPEYALPWLIHLLAHQDWFDADKKANYDKTAKYVILSDQCRKKKWKKKVPPPHA